jgi:hypothetical protein
MRFLELGATWPCPSRRAKSDPEDAPFFQCVILGRVADAEDANLTPPFAHHRLCDPEDSKNFGVIARTGRGALRQPQRLRLLGSRIDRPVVNDPLGVAQRPESQR